VGPPSSVSAASPPRITQVLGGPWTQPVPPPGPPPSTRRHLLTSHTYFSFPLDLELLCNCTDFLCFFNTMLLKAAPAFSLLHAPCGEALDPLFFSVSSPSSRSVSPLNYSSASLPSSLRFSSAKKASGSVICLASKGPNDLLPSGVVFQPFEDAKKELDLIPIAPHLSLARKIYSDECEAAVNEQIKWVFCLDFIASNLLRVL
jgi:hypothetical protein